MSVCPFCNQAAVIDPQTPCRSCGRRASDHPSVHASAGGRTLESDGWDDPGGIGDLDLSRGGSMESHSGPSAYAGGGLSLGDADDPFADDAPQGALELDLPSSHTANAPRSIGPAPSAPQAPPPGANSPPSSVPDLALPAKLQSSPAMPAARPPASDPQLQAPRPPASDPQLQASRPPASDPQLQAPQAHPSDPSLPPSSNPQLQSGVVPPAPPSSARRPADPAAAMIARYPVAPEKVWEAPGYALKVLWRQLELRQDLATLRKRRSPDVALYERALEAHDAKTFAVGLAITCAALALGSVAFFLRLILRFISD